MFQRVTISVFGVLLTFFCIVSPTSGQTLEEVINKHVAATGGAKKWKSLESFAVVSRSEYFSFDLYWKKPNRIRIEVPVEYPEPGLDIRSFDGKTGWRLNPMEGSNVARLMS